ncbi:glycosyltransferase [Spirochaetota bacterium]
MKLSIVIPVYNEFHTINEILKKVEKAPLQPGVKREIVIVDDYSTDGTRNILDKIKKKNYKIIYHEKNMGKGAALRTGYSNCTGDITIVQDADLEYDPNEYKILIQPIIDGKADVVYGSRFLSSGNHQVNFYWHMLGNKLLTLISNMFTNLHLTDMETCYKVFKREIIQGIKLEEDRFGIEPEVTAKIAKLAREENISIHEVSISYFARSFQEGKKIGMRDAFRAVWCIVKYNTTLLAKLVKYFFNGLIVAVSQFTAMVLFVEYFNFASVFKQNIAYALSIEISIIVGYLLHSTFTWKYRFKSPIDFLIKLFQFNTVTGISFLLRQGLFFVLLSLGMGYKLNTLIGICIAIIINFIGYNKLVFRSGKK